MNSDHHLLVAKIRLKLKKIKKQAKRKVIDIKRLKDPAVKQKFVTEIRNRFRALREVGPEEESTIEEAWGNIKKVYTEASEKVIGHRRRNDKEWLTDDTWATIEVRNKLKQKLLCARSQRLKEQLKKNYQEMDKQVKRNARRDKRTFLEEKAEQAERAAARGDLNTCTRSQGN